MRSQEVGSSPGSKNSYRVSIYLNGESSFSVSTIEAEVQSPFKGGEKKCCGVEHLCVLLTEGPT